MREDKPKGTFLIDIKIPSYIIFDYIIGRSPQHPFAFRYPRRREV